MRDNGTSDHARPDPGRNGSVVVLCDEVMEWGLFDLLQRLSAGRVVSCSNLRQMVDACSSRPPSAVVMDLDMVPGGFDAVETISEMIGTTTRMVVLCDGSDRVTGSRSETIMSITKPASAEQVVMALRRKPATSYVRRRPGRA